MELKINMHYIERTLDENKKVLLPNLMDEVCCIQKLSTNICTRDYTVDGLEVTINNLVEGDVVRLTLWCKCEHEAGGICPMIITPEMEQKMQDYYNLIKEV